MRKPVIGVTCAFRTEPGEELRREEIALPTRYLASVIAAGGLPAPLVPTADAGVRSAQLGRIDGLLLIGGADIPGDYFGEETHPSAQPLPRLRVDFEIAMVRQATAEEMPIFGICCGQQMVNVALGGGLIQDIESLLPDAIPHRDPETRRATTHEVEVDADSRLREITGHRHFAVRSAHHQCVGRLGETCHSVAQAPDGVIEAIEVNARPFAIGVQWHPELEASDEVTRRLFAAFVAAAGGCA